MIKSFNDQFSVASVSLLLALHAQAGEFTLPTDVHLLWPSRKDVSELRMIWPRNKGGRYDFNLNLNLNLDLDLVLELKS